MQHKHKGKHIEHINMQQHIDMCMDELEPSDGAIILHMIILLKHVWKWDIHTNTDSDMPSEWRMQHKHKGKHIEHINMQQHIDMLYGRLEDGDHTGTCSNTCGEWNIHTNTDSDMPSDEWMQHKHKGKHIKHINMQQHIDMCMDSWSMGRLFRMLKHMWKWDIHPSTNSDMPSEWRMQHKHKGKHIKHISMQQHIDMCVGDWSMGRLFHMFKHVWKWNKVTNTECDMPSGWRMQHKHKGKHIKHINMQQHIDMCMDD